MYIIQLDQLTQIQLWLLEFDCDEVKIYNEKTTTGLWSWDKNQK